MARTWLNPHGSCLEKSMAFESIEAERINSYALVTYIPEPLGSYLNNLRAELVTNCTVYSHVTILPPRPLAGPEDLAWEQIQEVARRTPNFLIETTRIEVFPVTNVIYLAIGQGWDELRGMHDALNRDNLRFGEPFQYHPHITLAQQLTPETVGQAYDLAVRRWAEFRHLRSFELDHMTFVQNTICNQWLDLNECRLAEAQPVPVLRR
jgi:2'-5' RNA ligase